MEDKHNKQSIEKEIEERKHKIIKAQRHLLNRPKQKQGIYPWFFKRWVWLSYPPEILLLFIGLISLFFMVLFGMFIKEIQEFLLYNNQIRFQADEITFIVESIKILGASFSAGLVALLVTNTWQQKSLGFELLKELYSPELIEVRQMLVKQAKYARENEIDLENVSGWFPYSEMMVLASDKNSKLILESPSIFKANHALSAMAYFVVRLSNYSKYGMLNLRVSKRLFRDFFSHYEIILLEFADKYEDYLRELIEYQKYNYDFDDWKCRAEDIRFFFHVIGLKGDLDDKHLYLYFPSLNGNMPEDKKNRFANIEVPSNLSSPIDPKA